LTRKHRGRRMHPKPAPRWGGRDLGNEQYRMTGSLPAPRAIATLPAAIHLLKSSSHRRATTVVRSHLVQVMASHSNARDGSSAPRRGRMAPAPGHDASAAGRCFAMLLSKTASAMGRNEGVDPLAGCVIVQVTNSCDFSDGERPTRKSAARPAGGVGPIAQLAPASG